MALEPTRRLFTVEEYHRLGEAGILGKRDRVELIEGEIILMGPIGNRHAACVARLTELFVSRLFGRVSVWPQNPATLTDLSEPEPDLSLLRRREDFYASRHPGPEDILLVVEVADTSLSFDQSVKGRLYAATGVPEYWIVDLAHGRLEVYRNPGQEGYGEVERLNADAVVAPAAFPDLSIRVGALLVPPDDVPAGNAGA